jgi:hypothetical protein
LSLNADFLKSDVCLLIALRATLPGSTSFPFSLDSLGTWGDNSFPDDERSTNTPLVVGDGCRCGHLAFPEAGSRASRSHWLACHATLDLYSAREVKSVCMSGNAGRCRAESPTTAVL